MNTGMHYPMKRLPNGKYISTSGNIYNVTKEEYIECVLSRVRRNLEEDFSDCADITDDDLEKMYQAILFNSDYKHAREIFEACELKMTESIKERDKEYSKYPDIYNHVGRRLNDY